MEVPLETEFDLAPRTGIPFTPYALPIGNLELLIWLFNCNLISSKLTFPSSPLILSFLSDKAGVRNTTDAGHIHNRSFNKYLT